MLLRVAIGLFTLVVGLFSLDSSRAGQANQVQAKKLLLLGQGPDGHPPRTHEYMDGLQLLQKLLSDRLGDRKDVQATLIKVEGAWPEGPELIDRVDGVVLFLAEGAKWIDADAKRREAFGRLAKRGGGIVGLHWAVGTRDAAPIDNFLQLLGACHGGPDRKYKVLETDLKPADPAHPIVAGIQPFRIRDEFYYRLKTVKADKPIQPVLRATIDGQEETVAWVWPRPDGGRSFGFTGLHFHENWDRPEYRRLVVQGVLWSLKVEGDGNKANTPRSP